MSRPASQRLPHSNQVAVMRRLGAFTRQIATSLALAKAAGLPRPTGAGGHACAPATGRSFVDENLPNANHIAVRQLWSAAYGDVCGGDAKVESYA
jgi:hypothetical protein